ncbi:GntR family transcriptional regulator [Acutalibacter muris]|uniref:GntR family transcriptional regulator n=1 Tax=Acutalibacter muris TaxID=1796620 RepID=UPI0026F3D406|nr:GntR family transcriptional regulator [Acutalibacter muris]
MAIYESIKKELMDQIRSGELKEGDMIPTEMQLSKMFGVSRPTVRQALNDLVVDGYLRRVKGTGTFVTKPKILQEYTQFIESYQAEMEKKNYSVKTVVIETSHIRADDFLAQKLQVKTGEPVSCLKRLRFLIPSTDERPVLFTKAYIPTSLFPELFQYNFEERSLYQVLDENALSVKKAVREIEIQFSDRYVSRYLQMKENSPVFFISTVSHLEDGRVIEYSESIYPWDKNKFQIEIYR